MYQFGHQRRRFCLNGLQINRNGLTLKWLRLVVGALVPGTAVRAVVEVTQMSGSWDYGRQGVRGLCASSPRLTAKVTGVSCLSLSSPDRPSCGTRPGPCSLAHRANN
ncbi:hypothetical protein SKAU_G00070410 [Synaphobranchus kaupii]|uniref:Uncharacterized protein n=1 Tax=Synaphobranchus kaupii TaxID=118154 RepID=A0A9Q1G7K7_SYNKA|nr:hypothetical protein SKAU_G00070410 [Synaphobranchus kaupii]